MSYMYIMCFDQIHPLCYSFLCSLTLPCFIFIIFNGFYDCIFIHAFRYLRYSPTFVGELLQDKYNINKIYNIIDQYII
jgi:hypothetical protein